MQIDCYGQNSRVLAHTLATLAYDLVGYDFFRKYGFTPLTMSEPKELPANTDNEQTGGTGY